MHAVRTEPRIEHLRHYRHERVRRRQAHAGPHTPRGKLCEEPPPDVGAT